MSERAVRAVLLAVGGAAVAVGAWQLVDAVSPGDRWAVARWGAGVVVAHDLVVAPLAVGLGWLALRGRGLRRAPLLRGGLLLAAALGVLVLVLHATPAGQDNPTLLPRGTAPGTVAAVVVVLGALGAGAALRGRRRAISRRRPDPSR